ncbi:hypothetical protein GCM10011415_32100 [Salipiger pallidus]|uniref:Glycosyltransferase 2-like domain-containing protein n=1 Tax=Salipiger pallidus TaxID=1775170 RepID=A0A8J2ZMC4_9RHOB|nr:glycosyltransferase family 2 protein [Salipiger pallidus]GGG80316.1 hypothetical protein GCM10011415_32100 [Salipiger pallidus]
MVALPVSVVIVSRGRPDALRLCLTGVAQLDHPAFEVVVVACPEGIAAAHGMPHADRLKLVPFDEANISAARNAGIVEAAGEVVAFIDDDAVPEPTWLARLCAPFEDPSVMASGGFVRGRNGIDFQWRAQTVTCRAEDSPLHMGEAPQVFDPEPGRAIKLQGTNMAHRWDALLRMGGFDHAFRFYLDETDLDLRHAALGHRVAVVPLAEVHHGYAASTRRAADRSPRDLTEIGASFVIFLRRHCPETDHHGALARFRAEQRNRLLRYMRRGPLGPDDVLRLMRGFDRGVAEAMARPLLPLAPLTPAGAGFHGFAGRPGAPRAVLSGRVWQRSAMRRRAAALVAEGQIVSLFRFSHTLLRHRVQFHPDGFWEQIGGLWGRSIRSETGLRAPSLRGRLQDERNRVRRQRGED